MTIFNKSVFTTGDKINRLSFLFYNLSCVKADYVYLSIITACYHHNKIVLQLIKIVVLFT